MIKTGIEHFVCLAEREIDLCSRMIDFMLTHESWTRSEATRSEAIAEARRRLAELERILTEAKDP